MKIRCDRRSLQDAVNLAAGATASRGTKPILQTILFVVQGDRLELLATDLEFSIRTSVPLLSADEEGELALSTSTVQSILKEVRGESIDLSTDGRLALLRSGKSQFRLTGDSVEEFPEVPSPEGRLFIKVDAQTMLTLFQRTEFAAARELGRYAINGILVEMEGKHIRVVATDGRRMAFAEAEVGHRAEASMAEIIPLKQIQQLQKAIGPEDKEIELALGERRTFLRIGKTVLGATSVEAEFPDYRGAIPPEADPTVLLDRDEFFGCVRQAAVMAGDDARAITLDFSEGSLVFSSKIEGRGDARTEMSIDYVGDPVKISFNPDYLMDFSRIELPEQLPFTFENDASRAHFRAADGYVYVLMPIST